MTRMKSVLMHLCESSTGGRHMPSDVGGMTRTHRTMGDCSGGLRGWSTERERD